MTTKRIAACWAAIFLSLFMTIIALVSHAEGALPVTLRFFAMLAGANIASFLAMYLYTGHAILLVVLRRVLPAIAAISAVAALALERMN